MRLFIVTAFFFLIYFFNCPAYGQIRFYTQYEGIPLFNGGSWDFNILSGIKVSPDKEVLLGIGLAGKFVPKDLSGNIKFSKSSFSLGFNYYQNRQLYFTFNVTANLLKSLLKAPSQITAPSQSYKELLDTFLVDYQIIVNYIIFRRLHFSFGTGVIDFTNLLLENVQNVIKGNMIQPNISLSLKLYVFQIKL